MLPVHWISRNDIALCPLVQASSGSLCGADQALTRQDGTARLCASCTPHVKTWQPHSLKQGLSSELGVPDCANWRAVLHLTEVTGRQSGRLSSDPHTASRSADTALNSAVCRSSQMSAWQCWILDAGRAIQQVKTCWQKLSAASIDAGNTAGLAPDSAAGAKAQAKQLEAECQGLRMQLSELRGQLQSSQRSPRHTVPIPGGSECTFSNPHDQRWMSPSQQCHYMVGEGPPSFTPMTRC